MKNLFLLPTDKPSRLIFNSFHKSFCYQKEIDGMYINDGKVSGADFWGLQKALNNGFKPQNIYITNSEEIKEGDWFYEPINKSILKYDSKSNKLIKAVFSGFCNKIILTTDQDLIKDGVQKIDDDFLEWFVKNSSCEEVEVESIFEANPKYRKGTQLTEKVGYWSYKIIIPKQSTKDRIMAETSKETKQKSKDYGNSLVMKQTAVEWLENELGKNPMPHGNRLFLNKAIEQAKEMEKQQQSYSEVEIIEILMEYDYSLANEGKLNSVGNIKKWFEQFKNK
jgi:hypothetical protein